MAASDVVESDVLHDCDPCKIVSRQEHDAVIYCPECDERLCVDCKLYHEKLAPTRQHIPQILIPQNQLPKTASTTATSTVAPAGKGVLGKKPTKSAKMPDLSLQFDVSVDTDKRPCHVTGVLILDKIIIIIDNYNETIKIFDRRNYSFKYQCAVESPWNAEQIKKDQLVVTSTSRNFFSIYTFSDKSATMKSKIKTPMPCWGVCYNKDQNHIYIVCTEISGKGHVAVYTIDGELTRRIEPLQAGLLALKFPVDIEISRKDKRIYVTDGEKGLVILSSSGKFESAIKPKGMQAAHGLFIDKNGQAYFTGLNSHNVFVLPPGGREANLLLSEDVPKPECIAVEGKQLVLGCRRTNLVKIFTLP